MRDGNGARIVGRVILALLTAYALAMIAPDLVRVVRPLGSFGFTVNADGLIFDVKGPFDSEEDSPAFQAGIRKGDRFDLTHMRCIPFDTDACALVLSQWGGVNFLLPGQKAILLLAASADGPAREVALVATARPISRVHQLVLVLTQIAGMLFILGAAWLVWIRPGPMTWGFFVYSLLFNPGQAFEFYAWLKQWPRALLAQDVASCLLQAGGYAGLLLFALRAPIDRTRGVWRRIERALPLVTIGLLALSLSTMGSLFGYRVEWAMRASMLVGFLVGLAAIGILMGRRHDLAPQDYQRIRWVIWGCLIGLPAYLIAELSQETSLLEPLFGETTVVPEEVAGLLYLINGLLCLFVVEAVRRPTVVNVAIPLRRATVLGLLLSVPVFFIHEEMNTLNELTGLPDWAWVLVASGLVFLISRAHEFTTELADRLFDREYLRAEQDLRAAAHRLDNAGSLMEIENLLVDEPVSRLKLASAALFRNEDQGFRRRVSDGWGKADAQSLTGTEPMLAGRGEDGPFRLKTEAGPDAGNPQLPGGLARPIVGLQVGRARRCFALALYGGHQSGTDLDRNERKLLDRLAHSAAHAYAQVETDALRDRVRALEDELARASAPR